MGYVSVHLVLLVRLPGKLLEGRRVQKPPVLASVTLLLLAGRLEFLDLLLRGAVVIHGLSGRHTVGGEARFIVAEVESSVYTSGLASEWDFSSSGHVIYRLLSTPDSEL